MTRYANHARQLSVLMLLAAAGTSVALAAPLTSTVRHEGNAIVIDVVTGGVTLTERDGNILPEMDECESFSASGAPMLPAKAFTLALPPNADPASVSVAVTDLETETVALPTGKRVQPGPAACYWDGAKTVVQWDHPDKMVDGFDMTYYGADALYPDANASGGAAGQMRKWGVGVVVFHPVRYNPVAGTLEVVTRATVTVSFSLMKEDVPAELMADTAMDREAALMFDNFDAATAWYPQGGQKSDATYDYVIVTTNAILSKTDCLAGLEELHEAAHNVLTVTENRRYDSLTDGCTSGGWGGGTGDVAAENLRNWLKTNYAAMGIKYVLLVGNPHPDNGDLAMKKTRYRDNEEDASKVLNVPTDTYFGELTGNWNLDNDQYFGELIDDKGAGGIETTLELVVGRIPVYSTDAAGITALESIVAKTINYKNAGGNLNWRKKLLLPVQRLGAETSGATLSETVRTDYALPAGMSVYRIYGEDFGYSPELTPIGYDNVKNEWLKGYGMVVWSTHGNSTFAADIFDYYLCPELDNSKPSFVFQASCLNAYPYEANNISYCLLKNGAVATIGASEVTKFWVGDSGFLGRLGNGCVARHYSKNIINGLPAGDALRQAKTDAELNALFSICPNYDGSQNLGWTNFLTNTLYGDPAVSLYDSGSGKPALVVNPNPVGFNVAFAHNAEGRIRVSPATPGVVSYTVTDNADWLTVTPDSGATYGEIDTLSIHVNAASLAVGVHTATITVTAPDAANSPILVPVKVTISATDPNPPAIGCSISSMEFQINQGENIPRQDFEVSAVGEGLLNCSLSQGASPVQWMAITPDSGVAYGTRVMESSAYFQTQYLEAGTHTATIHITGAQTPPPPNAPLAIPVTVHVAPPLAEALDTPDRTWTTGTERPWRGTLATSHDGVDSAMPAVSTGGGSSMSTMVQGPGTARFWWTTHSFPASGNFVQFRVDGNAVKTQMSSIGWTEVTREIPEGQHKLEWIYAGARDSAIYALVDQFSFTPVSGPYMASSPKKIVVNARPGVASTVIPLRVWNAGAAGTFNLTASESASELSLNNATATVGPEGHTVNAVFSTVGLASGTTRTGNITLSGAGAVNATLTVPYTLTVSDNAVSLADALDAPGLAWSLGPDSQSMWEGLATAESNDGVDAGAVALGMSALNSSLKTTVQGPGHLSFAWKKSGGTAESACTFAVDGKVSPGLSAPSGAYAVEELVLLPGSHELTWASTGSDGSTVRFFLDQVTYEEYVPEIALSVTEITATCQPGLNPASQTFQIWNAGTGPMEYQFESDSAWVNVLPGSGASQGEHDTVTVSFRANKLGLGMHTASITVSTVGVAAGTGGLAVTIPVTLDVGTKNVLSLEAAADNTLYEDAAGAKSNGAGPTIIVHKAPLTAERRGLLWFDVRGGLPSQALITDAKLEMTVLGVETSTALSVALRRVTKAWGEGASNAAIPDDLIGAASATGDATWVHTLFHSSSWATAGGDYSATSSATKSVGRTGACVWGVTPQLLADVQSWYTNPGGNYGWIMLPTLTSTAGWKRFASSEHATASERPRLTVTFYTAEPATALVPDVVGKSQANALAAITDADLVVGEVAQSHSDTVAAGLVISQDPPGDMSVLLGSLVDVTVSLGRAPVIVPDMRGMSSVQVQNALAAAGLTEGDKTDKPSIIDVNLLAWHTPAAGTEVPYGSAVNLVYSSGPGLVEVPNLAGVAESSLKTLLADASLSEGARSYENSDKIEPGRVISQNPAPGGMVMTNTEIGVVVSIGPRFVRVPDVGWATESEAAAKLAAESFVKGTVSTEVSFSVPAGRVVSQEPAAETMAPEGATVNIVLSVAPAAVVVPDIVGLTQANAADLLAAVLLSVGSVSAAYSDTVPAGVVLSQNPAAGGSVAPGTAVAMTVSAGPRPITGSILINNNRSATNNRAVTLSLTWDGGAGTGVVRMRFSDDGANWSAWEPLLAVKSWTLPSGDAHKTVRVQYLDKLNNRSPVFLDYIRLDTIPPTGTIIINGGTATTTTQSVTLGLTWADGAGAQVSRMRFSDNGSTWTPWMPPTATRAHTLPLATPGYQTVRVQYLDGAGNYSAVYNDYIKLVAP